jgi:hypothetical protein
VRLATAAPGVSSRRLRRSSAVEMWREWERRWAREQQPRCGEVVGGTAAECAAVFCCFPFAVIKLVVLATVCIPAALCRHAVQGGCRCRVCSALSATAGLGTGGAERRGRGARRLRAAAISERRWEGVGVAGGGEARASTGRRERRRRAAVVRGPRRRWGKRWGEARRRERRSSGRRTRANTWHNRAQHSRWCRPVRRLGTSRAAMAGVGEGLYVDVAAGEEVAAGLPAPLLALPPSSTAARLRACGLCNGGRERWR